MDIVSLIGIIVGLGGILASFMYDGGNPAKLINVSAIMIAIFGPYGALCVGYGINQVKHFPKLLGEVFKKPKSSVSKTLETLVELSETARKDGLLSLEKVVESEENKKMDPFLKRGILMVTDATDPQEITDALENEIYIFEQTRNQEITMFDTLAGFGPAFGMVGTLMGLVRVLGSMSSQETMVKGISTAFLATFFGVLLANLLYTPAARKLKIHLSEYRLEKEMIIEGVCAIRNGVNPRTLRERLTPYLILEGSKASKGNKGNQEEGNFSHYTTNEK